MVTLTTSTKVLGPENVAREPFVEKEVEVDIFELGNKLRFTTVTCLAARPIYKRREV